MVFSTSWWMVGIDERIPERLKGFRQPCEMRMHGSAPADGTCIRLCQNLSFVAFGYSCSCFP